MAEQVPYHLNITFDRNEIGHAARVASADCADLFSVAFEALQAADLDNVKHPEGNTGISYAMKLTGRETETRRADLLRRFIAMILGDLAKGIRTSLEEAATWLDVVSGIDGLGPANSVPEAEETIANFIAGRRAAAQGLKNPALLSKVKAQLMAPLQWEPELISFQKLRNCLEHRGGIVGKSDVDETGALSLRLPAMGLFITGEDGELVLAPMGQPFVVDTQLHAAPYTRVRQFQLGEPVKIGPSEISEIAFAVWMFADDLVLKFPTGTHQSW